MKHILQTKEHGESLQFMVREKTVKQLEAKLWLLKKTKKQKNKNARSYLLFEQGKGQSQIFPISVSTSLEMQLPEGVWSPLSNVDKCLC